MASPHDDGRIGLVQTLVEKRNVGMHFDLPKLTELSATRPYTLAPGRFATYQVFFREQGGFVGRIASGFGVQGIAQGTNNIAIVKLTPGNNPLNLFFYVVITEYNLED